MKIEIVATGERVEAESVELNFVRVGNRFYSPEEYRLVYSCDTCTYETTSGIDSVAHEMKRAGHHCDVK